MFAGPRLFARPVSEAIEDLFLVEIEQPAFQVDPHTLTEQAVDLLCRVRRRDKPVGYLVGNYGGLAQEHGREGGKIKEDRLHG
jgi:hypothetical protein